MFFFKSVHSPGLKTRLGERGVNFATGHGGKGTQHRKGGCCLNRPDRTIHESKLDHPGVATSPCAHPGLHVALDCRPWNFWWWLGNSHDRWGRDVGPGNGIIKGTPGRPGHLGWRKLADSRPNLINSKRAQSKGWRRVNGGLFPAVPVRIPGVFLAKKDGVAGPVQNMGK